MLLLQNILLRFIDSASFPFKVWRVMFNTVSSAYPRFLRQLIYYVVSYIIARFLFVSKLREFRACIHTETSTEFNRT